MNSDRPLRWIYWDWELPCSGLLLSPALFYLEGRPAGNERVTSLRKSPRILGGHTPHLEEGVLLLVHFLSLSLFSTTPFEDKATLLLFSSTSAIKRHELKLHLMTTKTNLRRLLVARFLLNKQDLCWAGKALISCAYKLLLQPVGVHLKPV